MSPRPLSDFPDAMIAFGAYGPPEVDPRIASAVVRHIATWSHIEACREMSLVMALEVHAELVASLLREVTSQGARDAVLRAALKLRLPAEDYLTAHLVWKALIEPIGTLRDKYAHHLWAVAPQLPEKLILIDPRAFVMRTARAARPGELGGQAIDVKSFHAHGQVYSLAEVEEWANKADSALTLASHLFLDVAGHGSSGDDGAEREAALAALRRARDSLPTPRPQIPRTQPSPPV